MRQYLARCRSNDDNSVSRPVMGKEVSYLGGVKRVESINYQGGRQR